MVNARFEIPVLAYKVSISIYWRIGALDFAILSSPRRISHIYIIGGSREILKELSWIPWLAFSGH
jgi:hypothetical protein